MGRSRVYVAVATALATAALLAGCTPGAPMPTPTASPSASPSPTSSTNAPAPMLRPGASAAANKQFFDAVNAAFWAANGKSNGEAIINNLTAAGFIKSDMEVTYDYTALGIAADAIIFSVRIQSECLVGQFGPTSYSSELVPVLGSGSCLVGLQRPIDW